MKISRDPMSEYHWGRFFKAAPTVLLNGKEQYDVIEADDAFGYVIYHKHDADGKLVLIGDELVLQQEHGHVLIVGRDVRRLTSHTPREVALRPPPAQQLGGSH